MLMVVIIEKKEKTRSYEVNNKNHKFNNISKICLHHYFIFIYYLFLTITLFQHLLIIKMLHQCKMNNLSGFYLQPETKTTWLFYKQI